MTSLEVFAAATAHAGDEQPMVVRARFSDGACRGRHRQPAVSSNQASPTVADEGVVKVQGTGEAAISVLSSTVNCGIRVAVPGPCHSTVYARAPRTNFYDGARPAKLQELTLEPSELSSDTRIHPARLLRMRPAVGRGLPRSHPLADAGPEQRGAADRRADRQRSEFMDYWAYKWSDPAALSSQNLQSNAMSGVLRL